MLFDRTVRDTHTSAISVWDSLKPCAARRPAGTAAGDGPPRRKTTRISAGNRFARPAAPPRYRRPAGKIRHRVGSPRDLAPCPLDREIMGDSKQQRARRGDRVAILDGVHANVGLLDQVFDVLRPGREAAQIPVQRRPVTENLIQEPFVPVVRHHHPTASGHPPGTTAPVYPLRANAVAAPLSSASSPPVVDVSPQTRTMESQASASGWCLMYLLNINGEKRSVNVPADMPLLWVLRDVVGLMGTKFGCGIAQCGACTVHLDGQPVRSCVMPVSAVGDKAITTIEGVGATPSGKKIQQAWLDIDVVQCGYCQSGQIMSAAALLDADAQSHRRRHRRRHVGQHLPLRHLRAHSRRHQAGGDRQTRGTADAGGGCGMSSAIKDPVDLQRRRALAAGGLSLAFVWLGSGKANAFINARRQEGDPAAAAADGNPPFAPNAFIRIDAEGPVRLVMPNVEMGQAIYTGACAMLAEELDVGMDQIVVEHAPPNDALYGIELLGGQVTGGSTSTRSHWGVLREAGAVARSMLVSAAAARWGVDPAGCSVKRGVVTHDKSGRKLAYGALAKAAGALAVPAKVALKEPAAFTLIGKPLRRVDSPDKVVGATEFGIDVKVPGMKIATVRACPTHGGTVRSVDEKRARALPGVVDVIKIDNAVAVVGEHFWAAKCGLEALDIVWDLGANADLTTAKLTPGARRALAERPGHSGAQGRLEARRRQDHRSAIPAAAAGACAHGAA